MRTADQVAIRPRPVWMVAAVAWVGLGGTFLPALASNDAEQTSLTVAGLTLFAVVYVAGLVAWALPRPFHLLTLRLGGLLLLEAGVLVLAAGTAPLALRVSAATAGLYTLALCMTRSVGDRMVDGGSYPGERRFAFRTPREALGGIGVACLVPSLALWACVAAVWASSALLRWAAGGAALAFAVLTWFGSRQLLMLGRRWFVFAPRAIAIVEPYLLADNLAVPLPRIVDISIASGRPDPAILDLRAAARGPWIQLLWDEEVEVPGPRRMPARIARLRPALAARAIGVAAPLSTPREFVAVAAQLELPTQGSHLDTL
ncbi:MAG: hypothetical protein IT198_11660 [Acidimicrobiia bacterium]|nr:hypothetical protein [Acidimicrobiia bacterium]